MNFKNSTNFKYLRFNLILILSEIVLVLLILLDILALDYGWEGLLNLIMLFSIILIQVLFLVLIFKVEDEDNQKTLYLGQLILFLCVVIWLVFEIEIHYKLIQFFRSF